MANFTSAPAIPAKASICGGIGSLTWTAVMDFINQRILGKARIYNPTTYGYTFTVGHEWRLVDRSVMFGGPLDYPASGHGTQMLAKYLRAEGLGEVIATPPRHNPRHPERKDGQYDLVVYLWTPDEVALKAWYERHKNDPGYTPGY